MMPLIPYLLFLAVFILPVTNAYAPDEIISLPGWRKGVPLPSRQYSGYLDVPNSNGDKTIHIHYWFVESEYEPESSPLVMWFNGGPGCSSLDGFFYEQGPFEIAADLDNSKNYSVNGVYLNLREHRWNRVANMLYFEAPVGVGFSYEDNFNYENDDDDTALHNLQALEAFFEKFPQYKSHDLFITGESYAGIYVPTLAEALLHSTEAGTYHGAPLKGIAVGNGCIGNEVGICGWSGCQTNYYWYGYLLNLAVIHADLKAEIYEACDWEKCLAYMPKKGLEWPLSKNCENLLLKAQMEIGKVNIYNVYGECTFSHCEGPAMNKPVGRTGYFTREHMLANSGLEKMIQNQRNKRSEDLTSSFEASVYSEEEDPLSSYYEFLVSRPGPLGCIDSKLATAYLMTKEVQQAINVREPEFCWAICNQAPGFSYDSTRPNLPRDTYPYLIANIEVLIYNGDWDACVPYTDNEAWTENMGFPVKSPWKSWMYNVDDGTLQVGGYVVEYNISSLHEKYGKAEGSFQFLTIKGAGHMVPTDAPIQGLEVLNRLIHRTDKGQMVYSLPEEYPVCSETTATQAFASPEIVAVAAILFVIASFSGVCMMFEIMRLRSIAYKKVESVSIELNPMSPTEPSEHGAGVAISPYTAERQQRTNLL